MSQQHIRYRWIALSLALAFSAQAQQNRAPSGAGGPERMARPPMGERRGPPPTEELKRVLALDAKQAQSVDEIFRRHREQLEQMHQRTREQHLAIAQETDARLRNVLSAKQFEAFQAWKAEHRPPPPRGGRRPPHRAPQGATPSDDEAPFGPPPLDAPPFDMPSPADGRKGG